MKQSMGFYKKSIALIVLCCTIGTTSQAIIPNCDFDDVVPEEKLHYDPKSVNSVNDDEIASFLFCNKLLALTKGSHCIGEAWRIARMKSTNKQSIQKSALASVVTSALVIGTKLFAAYKQRKIYQDKNFSYKGFPVGYLYPFFSIARNVFDLVKSAKIAKNAKIIAINNKIGASNRVPYVLLGLLAAEGACAQSNHFLLNGIGDEDFNNLTSSILKHTKAGSFLLWIIRNIIESKYLNTNQINSPESEKEELDNNDTDELEELK